jgi:hypothetical protein
MIENYCIDCIDCQAIAQADCDARERVAGTVRSTTTELKPALALDTEEEWRVHSRRDVVTSDNRYVAFATSDKHAARIVNDHNAAIHEGGPRAYLYSELQHVLKSQALLVEALRAIIEREGLEQCEIYHTGPSSCFTHGRRASSQLKAEQCCASCIADAALKVADDYI